MNFLTDINPETLADQARHWLIVGFVILLVAAIAAPVAFLFLLRWWYADPAVRAVWNNRKRIEENFGVKMKWISRAGRMKVAPKDSEAWARDYLSDELSNLVGRDVVAQLRGGVVRFYSKPKIPDKLAGQTTFDGKYLTIGLDSETAKPARVKLAETSCMIIAGAPGSGKTVLANSILDAIRDFSPRSTVKLFDGKDRSLDGQSLPAQLDQQIGWLENELRTRLAENRNRWHQKDPGLLFFAIDEIHLLVAHTGEKKTVLEERIARLRHIASTGREAGIILCLITQRATADAIPSPIRNVAGVSICGRCATKTGIEACLGQLPGDGDPNPLLFEKAGQFVVADGTGPWREVRAFSPA